MDEFEESDIYHDAFHDWCIDNAYVMERFASSDQYAEAFGRWLEDDAETARERATITEGS